MWNAKRKLKNVNYGFMENSLFPGSWRITFQGTYFSRLSNFHYCLLAIFCMKISRFIAFSSWWAHLLAFIPLHYSSNQAWYFSASFYTTLIAFNLVYLLLYVCVLVLSSLYYVYLHIRNLNKPKPDCLVHLMKWHDIASICSYMSLIHGCMCHFV